jgi:hypothetical protein
MNWKRWHAASLQGEATMRTRTIVLFVVVMLAWIGVVGLLLPILAPSP